MACLNFEHFILAYEVAHPEERIDLVEEQLQIAAGFPVSDAIAWLESIATWGEGQDDEFWIDGLGQALKALTEVLIPNVPLYDGEDAVEYVTEWPHEGFVEGADGNRVISKVVAMLCCEGHSIDVPLEPLLWLNDYWLGQGFDPGILTYRRQLYEKATPSQRVAIAEQYQAAYHRDGLENFSLDDVYFADTTIWWIREAINDAKDVRPNLVQVWMAFLRRVLPDPDKELGDFIDDCERWHRLASIGDAKIPEAARRYLIAGRMDRDAAKQAAEALQQTESSVLGIQRDALIALVRRDSNLMDPVLPHRLEQAACAEALEILRDYMRLERAGGASLHSKCSLLLLAIENQARWVLSRGLNDRDKSHINELGLGALARFISGRQVTVVRSDSRNRKLYQEVLGHLKVVGGVGRKLSNFLSVAQDIRNKGLHHRVRGLKVSDLAELKRHVLDTDHKSLSVMQLLRNLKCKQARS